MKIRTIIIALLFSQLTSLLAASEQIEREFILFYSGRILEGKARVAGKETKIMLSEDDYLVVPSEQIERTFRNRRDAYRYKIAVTPLEPRAQKKLFYWLCEQKAFKLAEQHLSHLEKHEPSLRIDFPEWKKSIQLKRFQMSVKETVPASSIDQNFRFRKDIEKHLLVGCSLAGCHRSGSDSDYQLHGSALTMQTKSTKNFEATLQQIQKRGPRKFLEYVSQSHGSLKRGIYPTARAEYLAIATWANSQNLSNSSLSEDKREPETSNQPRRKSIASVPALGLIEIPDSKPKTEISSPRVSSQSGFLPRDEFDPEIFNRMQQRKRQPARPVQTQSTQAADRPQRLISPETNKSRN